MRRDGRAGAGRDETVRQSRLTTTNKYAPVAETSVAGADCRGGLSRRATHRAGGSSRHSLRRATRHFRYDDSLGGTKGLFCLEVNTQPGMTETSLVPEMAQHAGISFDGLVRWMVEDASLDR